MTFLPKLHVLHPGDVVCAEQGEQLETLLGSCVAIVLTDPRRTVAVMCHFVHSRSATDGRANDGQYAEASPIWMDINPSDTLQYRSAREHNDERHICPLQLEVIRRCLRLWSNPGDLVLSPFAGIASEGYTALQMGRRFVGAELKRSYWEQACRNLDNAKADQGDLLVAA